MTTVDDSFRSVVRAWPVMVRVLYQLEKARVSGALSHNGGALFAELEALTKDWPSGMQLAKAYHAVAESEFSSQSYADSALSVQRWYTAAVNELNAELGITHCNSKDRHDLRVEHVDDLNRKRECIVCGHVAEVAVFEVGDWVWRKK